MKNLGEKLQEARNAMGLSLRDVADVTRLRVDVIENMESGEFNYKLPEIYKRGFLRLYATFLKMNVNNVMEEYAIIQRAGNDDGRRKNLLSRMTSKSDASVAAPAPLDSRFEEQEEANASASSDDSSTKFMKVVGISAVFLMAVVILIFIVSGLMKKSAPEVNSELSNIDANIKTQPANVATINEPIAPATPQKEMTVSIAATADTYVLIYSDVYDASGRPTDVLYTGPMQKGERKEFKSKLPVVLKLTDAEKITVERNAKAVNLGDVKGLKKFRLSLQ